MTTIAGRGDWSIVPMPESWAQITVDRSYSRDEFDLIAAGEVPRTMDDKWFIFYEEPWLYLHRSWTGYCIFEVRFEQHDEGARIVEARVTRDAGQYRAPNDGRDSLLLGNLLDGRAGRDIRVK